MYQDVAVIGAGTMGNGIAHVFAQSGYHVNLIDVNTEALDRALATIAANLDRQIKKEIITADQRNRILSRINRVDSIAVEIIRGYETSDEVLKDVLAVAEDLGKEPHASQDYPGFVANRILMPMINEAIWTLHEGVATREDIDAIMKLGMNHPMGPLTLADFIGLDVCLAILRVLHDGFGNPKYAPCPLLVNMVNAGHLGRKAGQGFYDYTPRQVPA